MDLVEKAVALDPNDPRTQSTFGFMCAHLRDFDRAERHFDLARSMNPNDATVQILYAYLQSARSRPERGLAAVEIACRLNPRHPPWYNSVRARLLFQLGNYGGAAALLASRMWDEPARHLRDLGWRVAACAHAGRLEEAAHWGESSCERLLPIGKGIRGQAPPPLWTGSSGSRFSSRRLTGNTSAPGCVWPVCRLSVTFNGLRAGQRIRCTAIGRTAGIRRHRDLATSRRESREMAQPRPTAPRCRCPLSGNSEIASSDQDAAQSSHPPSAPKRPLRDPQPTYPLREVMAALRRMSVVVRPLPSSKCGRRWCQRRGRGCAIAGSPGTTGHHHRHSIFPIDRL